MAKEPDSISLENATEQISRLLQAVVLAGVLPSPGIVDSEDWKEKESERVAGVLADIAEAYLKARELHGPMRSDHEGYAVILEELDEAREEIKNDSDQAAGEIVQVGAMALRFLVDGYT